MGRRGATVFLDGKIRREMASTLVFGGSRDLTAKKTVKRHLPSNVGDLVLLLFCGFFVVEFSPFLFIKILQPYP